MMNQVARLSQMPRSIANSPVRGTGQNCVELAGWVQVIRVEFAGTEDNESHLHSGIHGRAVGTYKSGDTKIVEKGFRYGASIVPLPPI